MPVIRAAAALTAQYRDELAARLAGELGADPLANPNGEPLVFENPLTPSDKFFVVVVWSEWERVPWAARPPIIAEAYRRFDHDHPGDPPRLPTVGVATGLTWAEADSNAFFKYAVEPAARRGEVDPAEVRRAMLAEGGYETPSGVKLRFMLRGPAEEAFDRLQQKLPAAHWSLSELVRVRD